MRSRHFFLNFLASFIFYVFLISPSQALKLLNDAQEDEVHKYLIAQWKPVKYKQPLGFETIFQELDSSLWPALPESYEWRISEDKKFQLFKHELAQDHSFDFVTYTTDSLSKFSFLSRWDGITHHSFAYTRQNSPLSGYDSARNVFPINEFRYKGQVYMRGHCIDFLDTYGLSENSKIGSGTIIESISTLDPRNYIPEPRIPTPYWGETLRKHLVGQIRSEGGCYAQYMHYGLMPLRTDDETATAIPQEIYFVRTRTNQSPLTSYLVPWSYNFAEKSNQNWSTCLQGLQTPKNFFPGPFVHNLQKTKKEIDFEELPLTHQLPNGALSWEEYSKIVKAADHEVQNVMGKIILTHHFLNQNYDSVQIQIWLKRLIEHGIAIHERDSHGFLDIPAAEQLLAKLTKTPEVDKDHTFADWLKQLHTNDQDQIQAKDNTSFSQLPSLKISSPPPLPPMTEIDVNAFKKVDDAVHAVINQLRKEPRVCLLNLTTTRANRIASTIKSEFSSLSDRGKISITYTLNQDSPYTKGIRPAFTNIGITPTKIDARPASTSKI